MGAIVHRLRITINGHAYDVAVEEMDAPAAAPASAERAVAGAPPSMSSAPAPAEQTAGTRPAVEAAGGAPAPGEVRAPLPGVVTDVKVRAGQSVAAGQVLLVLEAMKMDNEITAPSAGSVRDVRVAKGEQVASDQVLVVLG